MKPWVLTLLATVMIILGATEAYMSTYGGVNYKGKNLELWLAISTGHSGDGQKEEEKVKRREAAARKPMDQLGEDWDQRVAELRGPKTQYPWAKELILPYHEIQPVDASEKNGERLEIYLENIFEAFGGFSDDAFNRPNGAVLRAKYQAWLPLKDLMTAIMTRWAWEFDASAKAHREEVGKIFMNELLTGKSDTASEEVFLAAQYTPDMVEKIKQAALGSDPKKRLIALRVLARGGWVADPAFYGAFLKDKDEKMAYESMLGLLLIPNDLGRAELKKNMDSVLKLVAPEQQGGLKKYLSGK